MLGLILQLGKTGLTKCIFQTKPKLMLRILLGMVPNSTVKRATKSQEIHLIVMLGML